MISYKFQNIIIFILDLKFKKMFKIIYFFIIKLKDKWVKKNIFNIIYLQRTFFLSSKDVPKMLAKLTQPSSLKVI